MLEQTDRPSRITAMLILAMLCGLPLATHSQSASPAARCGGEIEKRTWQLWDSAGHAFIRDTMMHDRLLAQGDTYALYDTQTYLQNLASMAARCNRSDRLGELSATLAMAYDHLEPVPGSSGGRGWLCRGGRVCNGANRLAGTEIKLNSLQFLVLAVEIADGLERTSKPPAGSAQFVEQTLRVALAHLDRWIQGSDPSRVAERLAATPASVTDGQSRLFFTDEDLWTLTLESQVAGTLDTLGEHGVSFASRSLLDRIGENFRDLARLLVARLTVRSISSEQFGNVVVADLDRGYWRRYADNRFAAYSDPVGPISCSPDGKRVDKPGFNPKNIPIVNDIGWDFSHARRFVPAFDSLDRNRSALMHVLRVSSADLPPARLSPEFAATLVMTVWNGDAQWPLFNNFWNGSNGWYRVAYDNGTVRCFAGYGPYSLSDSFTTGGYPVWQQYQPLIGALAMRLYEIADSSQPDARAFVQNHYSGLSPAASTNNRMLTQLMFWPSLVTGQ